MEELTFSDDFLLLLLRSYVCMEDLTVFESFFPVCREDFSDTCSWVFIKNFGCDR